ncbi:unnamed protein product, partial [Brassica napus]
MLAYPELDRQEVTIAQVVCNKCNCITICDSFHNYMLFNTVVVFIFLHQLRDCTSVIYLCQFLHALAFKAQKDVNVISWNRFFCQVFWYLSRMLWYHILRSISILPRRLSKALMNPRLLQPLLAITSSRK